MGGREGMWISAFHGDSMLLLMRSKAGLLLELWRVWKETVYFERKSKGVGQDESGCQFRRNSTMERRRGRLYAVGLVLLYRAMEKCSLGYGKTNVQQLMESKVQTPIFLRSVDDEVMKPCR